MTRSTGNTLAITLLALALATILGLCFAPLLFRNCGHRCSLVDRWFPQWRPHHRCAGDALVSDFSSIHRIVVEFQKKHDHLPDSLSSAIGGLENFRFKHTYTRKAEDWQISVAKTDDRSIYSVTVDFPLPGWYLLTSDGHVHFNEKGPATTQDPVLP
jgi:hypothetical protein